MSSVHLLPSHWAQGYEASPHVHALANMEPRLWSWPIRWQGTHGLWVITHVQPTNQSMRHPLMTGYGKNNLQMIRRRGSNWGWSVLTMFVHEFQSLKSLNLEKPTSIPHYIMWNSNSWSKNNKHILPKWVPESLFQRSFWPNPMFQSIACLSGLQDIVKENWKSIAMFFL